MDDISKYGLNIHCNMLLEEYREALPVLREIEEVASSAFRKRLRDNNIVIEGFESRIKTEKSLAGKLERKGAKYATLGDMTDLVGLRIVTFYSSEVDKVAALAGGLFDVDWANSVDKRKYHELDSFGYMSLHFICRIPASLYSNPACPEVNSLRFELQMRTALQHVWANMYHDTGYKSGVEIPQEYLRSLVRLSGLLELADEEFSRLRSSINEYRRKAEGLVSGGRWEEVPLNGDTFRSFIALDPFEGLTRRIAAVNQAEVHPSSAASFFNVFVKMGFKTLGDVVAMKNECSDAAYQFSLRQIGGTDLDIISSTLSLRNLCIVYILKHGGGEQDLVDFFDTLEGKSDYNRQRAARTLQQARQLRFMQNL